MLKPLSLFSILMFCAALAGCSTVPTFRAQEPIYKPLSADLAAMGAPKTDAAQVLTCQIGKGQAMFGKYARPFGTVTFTLAENARTNITLRSSRGDATGLQGIFDHAGQKLVFCPIVAGPAGQQIACASYYALDDDFAMGIRRTFDVPKAIIGAELSCGYDATRLPKL